MPGENITRAEARERSAIVRDVDYHLEVDLSGSGPTFRSKTTVTFTSDAPGSNTWLDLIAPNVRSVSLNGNPLDVADVFADSRIALPDLADHNVVVVDADCAYMSTGEGLHRFVDPVDDTAYLYTQFEVADCRRVMATFEQPDIKAPWQLDVTAPDDWQVVSNSSTPEPELLAPGTARWSFAPTPPLSSYLYAIIAGNYSVVRSEYVGPNGTYPLGLFCRASLAESLDADDIFEVTRQGFAFYEDAFDYPYPFGKYDQIFVPEFNSGAMENPGAVTFHEDLYIFRSRVTEAAYEMRAETILHEMAHMWFGDLVTMTWWDDLWLNESFAEWAAHHSCSVATRFTTAWANFSSQRKAWAYRQDQLPSTHPIAADMHDLNTVYTNFDGITYAKGASALRQLVAWVGEDNFLSGLRDYFAEHAYGNTTLTDLLAALSHASGRELDGWAAAWLQTSGVNLIRTEVEVDDDGRYTSFRLLQDPPTSPTGVAATLRPHRLRLGLYDLIGGRLKRRNSIELDLDGASVQVDALIGIDQPDLLLINDDDLTFAKIRLDPRSLATAVDSIGTLDDPLARALLWGAAWDMTRDAEMACGAFVELVASGIAEESDVGVVGQVLRQVQTAVHLFSDPHNRGVYGRRLAAALQEAMDAAAPGSDHQLAFLRGFIAFADGVEDVEVLRNILSGQRVPPGLSVDTDVRWSIVSRLASMGVAGEAEIAEQRAMDDTAAGHRRAAAAVAAIPDRGLKQAAWDKVLTDDTLPNAMLEAIIGGIMQPDQADLVSPFIDRYFEAIPRIAAERTPEIGQQIIRGLFPSTVVDVEVVARTDRFLEAHPDLNSGARRLLVEGRDGLVRALRCRTRDAED